jgi:hypothetical protein
MRSHIRRLGPTSGGTTLTITGTSFARATVAEITAVTAAASAGERRY